MDVSLTSGNDFTSKEISDDTHPMDLATCIASSRTPGHQRSSTIGGDRYGTVVGVDDSAHSGTYAWMGVPFAKPPIGALRWKAPVDPDAWASPKATQQFGNACAQYGRIYGPGANNQYDATIGTTLNQAVGSEDCLYLNIWRPATHQGGLPVIVFIHGGRRLRHRRSGLRRRRAREGGERRRRDGELPPRHLRLPQPAATEDGHGRRRRFRQLRAA
jgi:hypothetical protein